MAKIVPLYHYPLPLTLHFSFPKFRIQLFSEQNLVKLKIICQNCVRFMARIFLTGGTGFVGSFIAEYLTKSGHHVSCFLRKSSSTKWLKDLPVDYCIGSFPEYASYREPLEAADIIIHAAGKTKARTEAEYFRGNVETTRHLLLATEKYAKSLQRFVHISSQAAVGPSPSPEPVHEDHPAEPVTFYGKSKLKSEEVVHSFSGSIPATIIRPPSVYGPRDTDVYKVFRNIGRGLNTMISSVDPLVSLIYVEDLALGVIQAAFAPPAKGKTYFLCENEPYYWSEIAEMAGNIMDKKYITVRLPLPVVKGFALLSETFASLTGRATIINLNKMNEIVQPYWVISPQNAQQDFGYQTRFPLKNGLKLTIDWYRENGWL